MARGANIDLWAVGILVGSAAMFQWMSEAAGRVSLLSHQIRPVVADIQGRTGEQLRDAILSSRDAMRDQCEQLRGNRLEMEHEIRQMEHEAREFERDLRRSIEGPVHIVWR